MGSSCWAILFTVLCLVVQVQPLAADQRPWVWTYGRDMQAAGEAELEHYLSLQSVDWSAREENLTSVHQVEVEIGMSPRLDVAMYQVFTRTPGSPLDWSGFKLRTRWSLLKEESPGHPVLYLEYSDNATLSEGGWEAKLLLDEDWASWRIALNPVVEWEAGEWEGGANAAFSWKVGDLLSLGGEARLGGDGLRVGPTLAHGGPGLWSALGASWPVGGIQADENSHEFRVLIGLGVKP